MLRGWLVAGDQRREARIAHDQPGYFGRSNFCRLESCIETSGDSVLLALEIEEAQEAESTCLSHAQATSLPHMASVGSRLSSRPESQLIYAHTPSPGPRNLPSRSDISPSSRPVTAPTGECSPCRSPPPSILQSRLKLQRSPNKDALMDVKQLPSIWTSKPISNVNEVLEGFHKFSDMRSVRKAPGSARRPIAAPQSSENVDEDGQPLLGFTSSTFTNRTDRSGDREKSTVLSVVPWKEFDRPTARTGRTSSRSNKFSAYKAK